MGYIRPATAADARSLAPRLRQEDVVEAAAAAGQTPLDSLLLGLLAGPTWAICTDAGLVAAMYGVGKHPWYRKTGIIWMLASPDIASPEIRREFIQRSREMCDRLHERYTVLTNYIDARNTLHLRWLKWCGFEIVNTVQEFGHGRLPFHEFVRIKKCASS